MAYSRVVAVGNGVTTQFTVNFALDYISEYDVTCRVGTEIDGSGQPAYRPITFLSTNLVQVSGAPAGNGVQIVFDRTVDKDDLVVDYNNGDQLDEDNLMTAQKQLMMVVHEVLDGKFTHDATAENAAAFAAAQVILCQQQVALAAAQAGLATTNGAAQVALAATQAGLATTNGDAQVTLAAAQVSLAIAEKNAAVTAKVAAEAARDAAAASAAIATATGTIVQSSTALNSNYANSAGTAIPCDDTVPQSTEGFSVVSATITPKSTTNKLRVRFTGSFAASTTDNISAAVFLNSETSARASRYVSANSGFATNIAIEFEFVPGIMTACTIAVRLGPSSGTTTVYINGNTGGRLLGGSQNLQLVLEEIKA